MCAPQVLQFAHGVIAALAEVPGCAEQVLSQPKQSNCWPAVREIMGRINSYWSLVFFMIVC